MTVMNCGRYAVLLLPLFANSAPLACHAAQGDDLLGSVVRATTERNDQLRKEYQEAIRVLKAEQGKVSWAEAGFRDVRFTRSPFEGSTDSLTRTLNQQRMALQRLTTLPTYELRHNITKGDALNRLLDILGPIAIEHERRLQRLQARLETELTEEQKQQHEFLKAFESDLLLTPLMMEGMEFQVGLTGDKGRTRLLLGSQSGEVRSEAFPLSWTTLLRNTHYELKVKAIEDARRRLLGERLPAGITEAMLFTDLFNTIDDLTVQFRVDYDRFLKSPGKNPGEVVRYHETKRFINDTLRPAAYRWQAEGRTSKTVAFWPFARKHPDGRISVIQLMAFLHEQGWRFPEAFQPGAEQSHRQLFDVGQRYYLKLAALRGSLSSFEQDVARSKQDLDQEINREIAVENAKAMASTAEAALGLFQYLQTIEENQEKQRDRDRERERTNPPSPGNGQSVSGPQ